MFIYETQNESSQRIGPKPPDPPKNANEIPPVIPPKNSQQDPDYEVIEFSGQQYSNAAPVKIGSELFNLLLYSFKIMFSLLIIFIGVKRADGLKCDLCGSLSPKVKCEQCNNQLFCASCDDMFHRHPKRKLHTRKVQ